MGQNDQRIRKRLLKQGNRQCPHRLACRRNSGFAPQHPLPLLLLEIRMQHIQGGIRHILPLQYLQATGKLLLHLPFLLTGNHQKNKHQKQPCSVSPAPGLPGNKPLFFHCTSFPFTSQGLPTNAISSGTPCIIRHHRLYPPRHSSMLEYTSPGKSRKL